MAHSPDQEPEAARELEASLRPPKSSAETRWESIFQRTPSPLFLLNPHRRFLFVNRAWERLTDLSAESVRGSVCSRSGASRDDPWDARVRTLCCPPAEVLAGRTARLRRLAIRSELEQNWWDLDYFPLGNRGEVVAIVGRIIATPVDRPPSQDPLPESLAVLRHEAMQGYRLESLASDLPAMRLVVEQVRLACRTRASALLLGEPGAGKRWTARVIHAEGTAREQSFAALDCERLPPAALSETLLGAVGLIRSTRTGTLYLREPSRMPRELQARIAEILAAPNRLGPQVLAGMCTSPAEEVGRGRLLGDLHAVLGTLVMTLPPLCERAGDLARLSADILECEPRSRDDCRVEFAPDAWESLRAHRWPGNLRELRAVLVGAREHAQGRPIETRDLPGYLRCGSGRPADVRSALPLDQLLEQAERRLIALALKRTGGNKTKAAQLLAIWRPRLIRRMEALGIAGGSEGEATAAPASGEDDSTKP